MLWDEVNKCSTSAFGEYDRRNLTSMAYCIFVTQVNRC